MHFLHDVGMRWVLAKPRVDPYVAVAVTLR